MRELAAERQVSVLSAGQEHETRECIDSLTAAHQRVLEDKDNASKLKDSRVVAAHRSRKSVIVTIRCTFFRSSIQRVTDPKQVEY